MNPGYLSYISLAITLILLIFGWKEQLAKKISTRSILSFFLCWMVLSNFYWRISDLHQINLFYIFSVLITLRVLIKQRIEAIYLFMTGCLVSGIWILFNNIYVIEPAMIFIHSFVGLIILISGIIVIFIKEPLQQLAVITIGIFMGDFFLFWITYGHIPLEIGTAKTFDLWWLIFLITRLLTEILHQGFKGWDKFRKHCKL